MNADEPAPLHRPRLHRRRNLVGVVATAGVCFAAGVVVALGVAVALDEDATTIVPVATPLEIQLSAAPPITVVAPPAPAPAPAPAPIEEEAEPPPPPRATMPRLDAQCFAIHSPEEDPPAKMPESCQWDDGFPAVSRDGKLVVAKVMVDDGGRGNPNLTIRFLDVATSKVVRDIVVLDPDEVDASDRPAKRAQLQRKVAQRMALAQRVIDQRGYRSLELLGTYNSYHLELETDRTRVHAEFDGNAVRAIDPATNRVLWAHRFVVPNPNQRDIETSDCAGWRLRELAVAWDPETRVVIGTSSYDTGGCMCDTLGAEQIVRMP